MSIIRILDNVSSVKHYYDHEESIITTTGKSSGFTNHSIQIMSVIVTKVVIPTFINPYLGIASVCNEARAAWKFRYKLDLANRKKHLHLTTNLEKSLLKIGMAGFTYMYTPHGSRRQGQQSRILQISKRVMSFTKAQKAAKYFKKFCKFYDRIIPPSYKYDNTEQVFGYYLEPVEVKEAELLFVKNKVHKWIPAPNPYGKIHWNIGREGLLLLKHKGYNKAPLVNNSPSGHERVRGRPEYYQTKNRFGRTFLWIPANEGFVPAYHGGDWHSENWLQKLSTLQIIYDSNGWRHPAIPEINYEAHGFEYVIDWQGREVWWPIYKNQGTHPSKHPTKFPKTYFMPEMEHFHIPFPEVPKSPSAAWRSMKPLLQLVGMEKYAMDAAVTEAQTINMGGRLIALNAEIGSRVGGAVYDVANEAAGFDEDTRTFYYKGLKRINDQQVVNQNYQWQQRHLYILKDEISRERMDIEERNAVMLPQRLREEQNHRKKVNIRTGALIVATLFLYLQFTFFSNFGWYRNNE